MTVVSGFLWDQGNWPECGKHSLSQTEIESLFEIGPSIYPDPSEHEERLRAIGKTDSGRYAFVVFVLREVDGALWIRPISARFMHAKEIRHYEQG
ncbi:hypothetical protein BJF92_10885 [Rhizobium rhizosphaerae]|uniref:BrnT family toxin n=1 Tax=Xaviernesmea rhizosphaerae TaxID=1672749 RepID=A0A1Q9AMI3_9HYPH|nr:BrnT family toxin [Xaviernesmea rhizosphaerae]OLP56594.1 hypothetical protein BJF92_10885 [Xaviernesmea rhizosphaerae]